MRTVSFDTMYKLRCEICGVIESEDGPDGLFEDLQDAALRIETHEEIQGSEHGVAVIGGFIRQHTKLPENPEFRK